MSDKYYQNEMDREMLLNIQIQKQVLSVLPQMNVSKQFINPTTQEMIDDYKKQFKRPGFKFQMPNYEPELERVGTLEVVFTDAELARKMKQLEDSVKEVKKINNTEIPAIELEIKNNRFFYNRLTMFEAREARILNSDNNELVKERLRLIQRLAELNTNIRTLNTEIEENNNKKESNIAKITTVQQNNQRKVKDYNDTLKIINFGNIDTTQQPGESEQDFLNRLTDIGLIQDDPKDAELFNINEFKKNMKTILNQEWLIENLIKSLDIANIFYINFVFPKFKKYFIDTFGINNKILELDDYIGIINDFIEKYENEDKPKQDTYVFYDQSQYYNYTQPPPEPPETFYDADADAVIEAKVDADIAEKQAEMEKQLKEDDKIEFNKNPIPDSSFEKKFNQPKPQTTKRKPIKRANELNLKNVEDFDAPAPAPAPAPATASSTSSTRTMPIFKDTTVDILYDGDNKIIQFTDKNLKRIYLMPYLKLTISGEVRKTNPKGVKYSYNNTNFADLNQMSGSQSFGSNIKIALGKKPTTKVPSKLQYENDVGFDMGEDDRKLFLKQIKESDGNERPALLYDVLMSIQDGRGIKKQKKKPKKKPTVQKGKSLKDVPSHCEFGKLIILLKKLYETNMLSVKDKNNINVQGIPNQKVSNNFVNILMKICTNKKINKKDINNLNQKETILYNVLLSKAGLSKDYDSDIQNTVKTIKNRLQLIEGQIQAGNNNNDLKKELYSIIFQLANIGAISISSARKYYNDTVKTYF